eukprot:1071733-Amphidinium_carterae.1
MAFSFPTKEELKDNNTLALTKIILKSFRHALMKYTQRMLQLITSRTDCSWKAADLQVFVPQNTMQSCTIRRVHSA